MWFQARFSAQHSLLAMVEKIKNIKGNTGVFAVALTDLSKAFDCIPHEKSYVFVFDKNHCPLFLPISITENKKLR